MPGVKPLPNSCCIVKMENLCKYYNVCESESASEYLICVLYIPYYRTHDTKRYKYHVHLYQKQLMNIVNCFWFFFATVPDLLLLLLFHKICTHYFFSQMNNYIITIKSSYVRLNLTYVVYIFIFLKWFFVRETITYVYLSMYIYKNVNEEDKKDAENYKIFSKFIDF